MYKILKLISHALSTLSPANAERILVGLAWLSFDLLRLRRGQVLANLSVAFPDSSLAARTDIARESYRSFLRTAFEFLRAPRVPIADKIAIDGSVHLKEALAQGRGAYILCFHMGNWEAMGAKINQSFVPAHVLVKRVGGDGVNRFVEEQRASIGFRSVRRSKKGDGLKAIQDILSRGEIVGFVMDQARPGEPRLPFFGRPAKTNTSFAAIWQRCPAPIIPAWIERHRLGAHTLHFFAALNLSQSSDLPADVLEHSTLFNAVVATHVRSCPEQYFWLHNRWKE